VNLDRGEQGAGEELVTRQESAIKFWFKSPRAIAWSSLFDKKHKEAAIFLFSAWSLHLRSLPRAAPLMIHPLPPPAARKLEYPMNYVVVDFPEGR